MGHDTGSRRVLAAFTLLVAELALGCVFVKEDHEAPEFADASASAEGRDGESERGPVSEAEPDGGDGGTGSRSDAGLDGGEESCVYPLPQDGAPDGEFDAGAAPTDGSALVDVEVATVPDALIGPSPEGDTWGFTSAGRLVHFARVSGEIAEMQSVSGLPEPTSLLGVALRPSDGSLVALSNGGQLFKIDVGSGSATLHANVTLEPGRFSVDLPTMLAGAAFGIDFDPITDSLFVVNQTAQTLSISLSSGLASAVGTYNKTARLGALAFADSFATACRPNAFLIDAETRQVLSSNSVFTLSFRAVGRLDRADLIALDAFEIVTGEDGQNTALVAATTPTGQQLFHMDLATGRLSNPISLALAPGEKLRAMWGIPPLAAPTQERGALLAISASDRLVSFNPGLPSRLCSSRAIVGLAADEKVIGTDVRPADGALYAVTNLSRVYVLDMDTGRAALKSVLRREPSSDNAAGYDDEWFYGVSFDPTTDLLHLVGRADWATVNVDAGLVTWKLRSDTSGPVRAYAFENSFSDARVARGLAVGTAARFCRMSEPQLCDGRRSSVLPGDVNFDGVDIDGATGTTYLATTLPGERGSTLLEMGEFYGLERSQQAIGGGEPVRALTFAHNPRTNVWVVTSDNRLVSFRPSAAGAVEFEVAIGGLQSGENILGIDICGNANGTGDFPSIFAIGSSERSYAIDSRTGSATLLAVLTPDSSEIGNSWSAGPLGSSCGPRGFETVNNAGYFSVRGQTVSRIASAGYEGVVAAAWGLSSVGGAILLMRSDTLGYFFVHRIGPVAGWSTIGPLGITATGDVGFDIVGRNDGLALAAINDGAQTSLYSIDATTGAATPFNANSVITAAGNQPVRGLAVVLR